MRNLEEELTLISQNSNPQQRIHSTSNRINQRNNNNNTVLYPSLSHHIIPLLLGILIFIITSQYIFINKTNNIIPLSSKSIRLLDPINEKSQLNNDTILDDDDDFIDFNQSFDLNVSDIYNVNYELINNLTFQDYKGIWNNYLFSKNFFSITNGECEVIFYRILNNYSTYKSRIYNDTKLRLIFYLKEGKYIDRYIRGNITLFLNSNFRENYNQKENDPKIEIENINSTIEIQACQYLVNCDKYKLNGTNLTVTLINNHKILRESFESAIIAKYSSVEVDIFNENFTVFLSSSIYEDSAQRIKVRNYSFILTILALFEIYFSFKLLLDVSDNYQVGLNLDLITITVSLLYKCFVFTAHFYFSITEGDTGLSYEYGIPSLLYFFAFIGFDLRLLFSSWKARYLDMQFENPSLFKKKIFIFYIIFYIILFFGLLFIKYILTSTIALFILFTSTWIFQIIHSIRKGTKPSMSYIYLLFNSISRLYLPIYLKGHDGNAFELRPSYKKVFLIILIVLIEMFIVMLQKKFGGKAIIPRCFKSLPYNYYRDKINIEEHIAKNPDCVICLESLVGDIPGIDFNEWDLRKEENNKLWEKIKGNFVVKKIVDGLMNVFALKNDRKKYMITPCDHVFHTSCLERWMEIKNECPYCKSKIPPIE